MDRFESMSAFVSVAKAGGFSAAARHLGIPLATISRRVADLEADLGVQLLKRSTRSVVLTEPGQAFYAASQRLLEDLKDAEDAVTGEYQAPKGELSITAPVGFGRLHLQPLALDFLAAYPDINLRLLLVDRLVNLVEEQVDLALRIAQLPDSNLIAVPLGKIRMVVCASPEYLARHGTPEHPRDIASHSSVAWASLGPLDSWWFHEAGADRMFPIRPRLWTTTPESTLAAARAGVGLLQTGCYQAEQDVREGKLVLVLREFECAPRPVNLVYARNRLLPLKLRAFLDFAAPRLRERLSAVSATIDRVGTP